MKLKKLFFAIFIVTTLVSCTVTENIYITDSGSGKFSVEMDGSALMAMIPNDSLRVEKSIDSTFSFKQVFDEKKDSIAALSKKEQERLKKIESFTMRMKMDLEAKQFLFSMNTDFKNVAELQDAMETINTVNAMQQNSKKTGKSYIPSTGFGSNNSALGYFYNGKKFIRKATLSRADKNKIEKDSVADYKMIFESSQYILKYHFPKPVKKVSNSTAMFSKDRKTITIEYSFNEYMENPDKLNIEVEF
jgi:hypothetical protein